MLIVILALPFTFCKICTVELCMTPHSSPDLSPDLYNGSKSNADMQIERPYAFLFIGNNYVCIIILSVIVCEIITSHFFYILIPVAIETLGPINEIGEALLAQVGKLLSTKSDDP